MTHMTNMNTSQHQVMEQYDTHDNMNTSQHQVMEQYDT